MNHFVEGIRGLIASDAVNSLLRTLLGSVTVLIATHELISVRIDRPDFAPLYHSHGLGVLALSKNKNGLWSNSFLSSQAVGDSSNCHHGRKFDI